jgi:hypothetical protein
MKERFMGETGRRLKRIEAALAKERMLAGRKIDPGKNFSKGRAEDNAAAAVGMSRPVAEGDNPLEQFPMEKAEATHVARFGGRAKSNIPIRGALSECGIGGEM